jgi:hypothetical protein
LKKEQLSLFPVELLVLQSQLIIVLKNLFSQLFLELLHLDQLRLNLLSQLH